jgi:hypothetical protein
VLAVMANHDKAGKGYLTHDEFVGASQDLFKCASFAGVSQHLPAAAACARR